MQIIDVHVHIGSDKDGTVFSIKDFEHSMSENSISSACVFPLNEDNLVEKSLAILELAQKYPAILPVLRFDPHDMTREHLSELLRKPFIGVKLHPRSQQFRPDDAQWNWVYEEIATSKKPVLFHCKVTNNPESHPEFLFDVAKRFPKLTIIAGHWLGDQFHLFPEAKKYDNLYIETSIYARTWQVFRAVREHGMLDKLLFGSDVPYSDQEVELKKITKSGLSTAEQEQICFTNAKKLFGL